MTYDSITDLRKAKVYAGLIGQKADLIHAFSSLNELSMYRHSISNQENYQGLAQILHIQTVLSFQKLQHPAQCLVHSGAQQTY